MGKNVFRDADSGEPTYLPVTKEDCCQYARLSFFYSILPVIAIAVTLGGREEGAHRSTGSHTGDLCATVCCAPVVRPTPAHESSLPIIRAQMLVPSVGCT